MKLIKFTPQKNTAQAMVEFAIVLPILLLLLYGLLEAGRLLFIYSSTVTASRQAVRYGATTGGTVPRYQDCAGIRQAAQKVDYLNAFDDGDIKIYHDTGPGSSPTLYCTGASDTTYTPSSANTDRLLVEIKGDFNPIVPKLVPFIARTAANGKPIASTSARTIVKSVTIAAPAGAGAATTKLVLKLEPHRNDPFGPHSDVGELVVATATLTNETGSTIPTGTVDFIIKDSVGTIVATCDDVPVNTADGTAGCDIRFNNADTFDVIAEYTPGNTSLFTPSSGGNRQIVGEAGTTTRIILDDPDSSQPGQAVTIRVQVTSDFGSIPTGPIVVTTAAGTCTINLDTGDGGIGSCSVTYNSQGTTNITAAYDGDSRHVASTSPAVPHTVATTPPTFAPTPKPPTPIPPTSIVPTTAPTPVSNCNSIRDTVNGTSNPIQFASNTMFMDIPNNANGYPVTSGSIYVAWNYNTGHNGSNTNLKLTSVMINSTVIWELAEGVHQPNFTITSFNNPAVFPANQTSQLIFIFDQTYDRQTDGQIQVNFSTPGCESYPVLVPVGTPPTLVPGTCGPINATISAPFTKDGAGTFCWQTTNLGTYINSWNLQSLTINGVNFTNIYIPSVTYPPKINGYWYVTYTSNVAWGHFEAK